jgi:hypothetical protein
MDAIDAQLDAELRTAVAEIRAKLEDASELDPPYLEKIRELVLRFESAHPALAEATGRVVRMLSRLGI